MRSPLRLIVLNTIAVCFGLACGPLTVAEESEQDEVVKSHRTTLPFPLKRWEQPLDCCH